MPTKEQMEEFDAAIEADDDFQNTRHIPDTILDTGMTKLNKDIKLAATTLNAQEARFLVDQYYSMQKQRIGNGQRALALSKTAEPNLVFSYLGDNFQLLEDQVKKTLEEYAKSRYIGRYMMSIRGIGPVIAAGLIAYIGDITACPTVGHIWAYGGVDPKRHWIGATAAERVFKEESARTSDLHEIARAMCEEIGSSEEKFFQQIENAGGFTKENVISVGSRRPWNAKLKVLLWKIGQSFLKQPADQCIYRKIYDERKAYEQGKNARGEYAQTAADLLAAKNYGKTTEAYKAMIEGRLSDGHIHARACRYAMKFFLSHVHKVWWEHETKTPAPAPFAIAHLGHAHFRDAPDYDDDPKMIKKYGNG